MLMLNVRKGDYIMIGDDIKITLFGVKEGGRVSRVGIEAPKEIPVLRQEVYERYNEIKPERDLFTVADL